MAPPRVGTVTLTNTGITVMPSRLINGARYAISTTLAAAVPITAISNANPAIASAAVLPVANDILVLASGWSLLNGQVAKALSPAAGSFTLAGINTLNAGNYPTGEGAGAYQVAGTFVGLSKVVNIVKNGGEQNYATRQYVEDPNGVQVQFPTFRSAINYQISMDYDPSLPWFAALLAADAAKNPVVLRETLPGGDIIYRAGLLSFDEEPSKDINDVMTVIAGFSVQSKPIRYAAP